MAEIYRAGIKVTPDTRLVSLSRSGNGLVARLANGYSGAESDAPHRSLWSGRQRHAAQTPISTRS
jgi:hypothetical protein